LKAGSLNHESTLSSSLLL